MSDWRRLAIGRGAAPDDASRARGRGRRHRGAARALRRRLPRLAVCRARSPIRPGSSATAKSAATSCARGSCSTARRRFAYRQRRRAGPRPVMTLRSRDHRRAGRSRPSDRVGYGATLHRVAAASHRRRRLRLRRRLSAPCAERHAGDRVRDSRCGIAGRVSMDMLTVDLSDVPRGRRRQRRRAVGRGAAGRRRGRRGGHRRLRTACAPWRRACRSSRPRCTRSIAAYDSRSERVHRRHRRRRIHRRPTSSRRSTRGRDATSSPSTT